MVSRLIKTQQDYERALSRIENLMDAEAETPEADELELLTALVEMYEDRHYPISPPDPIDAIRFRMEQLGLKPKDLIPYLGSRSKVSEILSRKRPLTLSMIRSLHKGLGIPAEVLLKEPRTDFPEEMFKADWSRFPLSEMVKRCWISKVPDLKERAEELMRDFIARAGGPQAIEAAFLRRGNRGRCNTKTDHYALAAWCMRVISLARQRPLNRVFVKGSVKISTMREVARLSYFENGPLLAKEYLEKQGIHLIVVRHLPKTYMDGAALLMPDGTPVIGLTLRYDRLDNFWFCLLHELAHVAQHLSPSNTIIVDDLDLRLHEVEKEDRIEKEADALAMEALIPKKVWDKRCKERKMTTAMLMELAEKLKIHPAIIAGRVRFEQNNYRLFSRYVGNKKVRMLFSEGCVAGAM